MAWLPQLAPERASGGSVVFRGNGQLRCVSCRYHTEEREWSILTGRTSSRRNWGTSQSFVGSVTAGGQSNGPGQCSKLWRPRGSSQADVVWGMVRLWAEVGREIEAEGQLYSLGQWGWLRLGSREWILRNTLTALPHQGSDQVGKRLSELGILIHFLQKPEFPKAYR